jgi:hypothetical protein
MPAYTEDEVVRRALLDVLGHVTEASNEKCRARHNRQDKLRPRRSNRREMSEAVYVEPPILRFSIIDRPSSLTMKVCWSDPRYGRHDEQTWRLGRAHFESCCLLTGGAIRHGDMIFRPCPERGVRTEGDRMILASAVDRFYGSRHDQIL